MVKRERPMHLVDIAVEVLDPLGAKRALPANEAVHLIPLVEEKLGQIRAVLAGDPGNERAFGSDGHKNQ